MSIKNAYRSALAAQGLIADEDQRRVVDRLDRLQQDICARGAKVSKLRQWLLGSKAHLPLRGIYLWGGVGRGKTFLMDLFFNTLASEKKRRIHFHRMMSDVHRRLQQIEGTEDPLDRIAADLADETSILCFDEFFVSDIADAMILGRLLDGLFRRGVVLVATSNVMPADLYNDGLQRQQFLPAIDALEQHTEIIGLAGETDYRLLLFEEAGTYLAPVNELAHTKLAHYFEEISSGEAQSNHEIDILGRKIRTQHCAKGIAWFDFMDICNGPRSQEDYIEIARCYPTVIISEIPLLTTELDNPARRFIALIDEFYERKVKLIISASTSPDSLYQGKRLEFEFRRTASRLIEMQSKAYLHAAHLP